MRTKAIKARDEIIKILDKYPEGNGKIKGKRYPLASIQGTLDILDYLAIFGAFERNRIYFEDEREILSKFNINLPPDVF